MHDANNAMRLTIAWQRYARETVRSLANTIANTNLSRVYLGDYWANFQDLKATWKPFGPGCGPNIVTILQIIVYNIMTFDVI